MGGAPAGGSASDPATKRTKQDNDTSSNTTTSQKDSTSTATVFVKHTYELPISPKMRNPKSKSKNDSSSSYTPPGLLAQTGTLDAAVVGRLAKRPAGRGVHDLEEPTLLFPTTIFTPKIKIALIATSSSSCHSIAVDIHGTPYGWGRNECKQLGTITANASGVPTASSSNSAGSASSGSGILIADIAVPTKLEGPWNISKNVIVGAAVGKSHSILVADNGLAYAAGMNKRGECGVNSSVDEVHHFRKCFLVGGTSGGEGKKADDGAKAVQVSCGENFSVILSSQGHLYSAGSAEFGQLGNGETGEYFVTASKIAFANSTKFERRAIFVQSAADAEGGLVTDSKDSAKMIPLPDSADIAIGSISCGKNHTIAVEAPIKESPGQSASSRVFSWGCGGYGCLGHNVQADEYTPRLISALRGPLFASNTPVRAAAGAQCSMILTKNGHVYYWGKHRQGTEATMRPTLIDALANNMHVVTAFSAGSQTVFCSTKNAVTVSWGQGTHGELGYGLGKAKSSAKPQFVEKLDKCLVSDVACGYGHTLFLIRDEDEEDKNALKKMKKLETDDVAAFMAEVAGRKIAAGAGDDDGDGGGGKKRGKGKK
mmetsp:Transcript_37775/g.55361  ORF Transcript_37775/g.55361 Transcript_37775/m.55361 type:complete len:598 (+) Transcript_37775:3-1796(+)